MQLITATWVLPITRPPLRDGGVVVDDGRIVECGNAKSMAREFPDAERVDLGEVVVTPGLVNAHTHLGLTAAAGLLPPDEFPAWLSRVPRVMRAWDSADVAASAALGARQCMDVGVTVVGEIAYGREAADAVLASGLGATLYWEVLGIAPYELTTTLADAGFDFETLSGERWREGISPHAPYSSSSELLQATHALASELGIPFAVHVAESRAEAELMRSGGGPLAEVAERLIPGFTAPDSTPVAYLDRLRVLDDALAVHVCEVDESDAVRLAASVRAVALCPRSNEWLRNRRPPAARLASYRVPISVGTDSAASNENLDVLADVRALSISAPMLSPTKLLRSITVDAAHAIGLEDRFGALDSGLQADLACWSVGDTAEPEAAVIARGGADSLVGLLVAGEWRRGQYAPRAESLADASPAAELATAKAVAALESAR